MFKQSVFGSYFFLNGVTLPYPVRGGPESTSGGPEAVGYFVTLSCSGGPKFISRGPGYITLSCSGELEFNFGPLGTLLTYPAQGGLSSSLEPLGNLLPCPAKGDSSFSVCPGRIVQKVQD